MTLSPEAREEAVRLANDLRQYSNKTVGSLRIGVDEIALIVQALDAFSAPAASGGLEAVREAVQRLEEQERDSCWHPMYRDGLLAAIREISAALAAPATPAGSDYAGDITPHDDKERGMAVLRDAYDFDIADDGTLCGLVAGDQGWASTHIKIKPAPDTGASVAVKEVVRLLEGALCDPGGRVCIDGSDADRAAVSTALAILKGVER